MGDTSTGRGYLRSAFLLALENAGFIIAITFVGANTVLPTFVTALGGSTTLVGLIATCQTAGWLLPQLAGARLSRGKARIMPYLVVPLYLGRPVFLIVGLLTLFLGAGSPGLLLAALFAALLLFWATDGISSVPWFEIVARAVPADKRGRMFGAAQVAGGLGGMGVGALVAVILKSPALPFPASYALLLCLSSAVFLLNLVPFWLLREPPHTPTPTASDAGDGHRGFLRSLGRIRRDGAFARLLASRLLFGLSASAFPFYILFMDQVLSVGPQTLGLLTSAQVFGGFVGGLAIGWMADRVGRRAVILTCGALSALVPAIAILMLALRGGGPALLYPAVFLFVLVGVAASTNLIGYMNYLMEIAPPGERPSYVGLFNTVSGVLMVAPPLLGWLLDKTGYIPIFVLAAVAGLTSTAASLGLRKPAPGNRAG